MRFTSIAGAAALAWAVASPALAQAPDYSKVTVKTTDLGHGTYMLEGAGGNVTVAVADDGIIMVDSQFAPMHDKLKAAITAISTQPIRYLVDTHFHGDHTGGNEAFAKDGATIMAHINAAKTLKDGTTSFAGAKIPPAPEAALPKQTYLDKAELNLKNLTAHVQHVDNAHTSGDSFVAFADADVVATGDIVSFGRYPIIDTANGGNIKGMIAGADTLLALVDDRTKIVPGHGPLGDKAKLQDYRAMLVAARDRVAPMVAAGKSEDEVVAAKPMAADYDAKVGADDAASAMFVRFVYRSLKS